MTVRIRHLYFSTIVLCMEAVAVNDQRFAAADGSAQRGLYTISGSAAVKPHPERPACHGRYRVTSLDDDTE